MNSKLLGLATLSALLTASSLSAQLFVASGMNTGVTSNLNFSIDPTLNRISVAVDNSKASAGGVTGTLMSFGFNVPSEAIALSGTLVSQEWTTLKAGHVEPAPWTLAQPYLLSGSAGAFAQDIGVFGGSNPNGGRTNQGILFGEAALFVFQFDDFATAAGFLGEGGISVRWQEVTAEPGSDKTNGGDYLLELTPVPEPSAYGLGAVAILAAGLLIQRQRKGSSPAPAVAA